MPHAGYHATPIPVISYSDFAADIYSDSYQIFAFGTRLITNAIKEAYVQKCTGALIEFLDVLIKSKNLSWQNSCGELKLVY